jgi:membrane fusion protein, copper/silver efflux system
VTGSAQILPTEECSLRKTLTVSVCLLLLMVLSFLAGRHFTGPASSSTVTARRVLYYVDPMHPSYRSDKPGTAPDCGMDLEPVYADAGASVGPQMPPGTVNVSYDKQQMIGVRVSEVEKSAGPQNIRLVGRVAVDEQRVYRTTAAIDGWIEALYDSSSGTVVKKDQLLGAYFAPELLNAMQAYVGWLESVNAANIRENIKVNKDVPVSKQVSVINRLRYLGMTDVQLKDIAGTRQPQDVIKLYSPINGFILNRSIAPGQRFDKGAELYRIADLSHVWILADIYENEEQYFRPGTTATVTLPNQGKKLQARVSNVLPQFDANTRTLKLRLEADNPGFVLRPDMFVDIDLPIHMPAGITVPVDAVLDSGLKKRAFVDRGEGYFEPREVETGWRFGDRVQIVKGLAAGEKVAVSGTFLLDSESRLKSAAANASATQAMRDDASHHASSPEMKSMATEPRMVKDLSCGMDIDAEKAKAAHRVVTYHGAEYYFCSDSCKAKFEKSPEKFLASIHQESHHD